MRCAQPSFTALEVDAYHEKLPLPGYCIWTIPWRQGAMRLVSTLGTNLILGQMRLDFQEAVEGP